MSLFRPSDIRHLTSHILLVLTSLLFALPALATEPCVEPPMVFGNMAFVPAHPNTALIGSVLADFNNDGILDLAGASETVDCDPDCNNNEVMLYVLLGRGDGRFGPETPFVFRPTPIPGLPTLHPASTSISNISFAVCDLDGDGNVDHGCHLDRQL